MTDPRIPTYTQETAAEEFRKCFSNDIFHNPLVTICLTQFEEIHGHKNSRLAELSSNELIDWFLSHHTFDETLQTWLPYNPYSRVERSDIYYDICKWGN